MIYKLVLILSFSSFLSASTFSVDTPIPRLSKPVVDGAAMMGRGLEAQLNSLFVDLAAKESVQMSILTVPTIGSDVLEEYSLAVVEKWKLGKASTDKGLLLLVVKDQRKIRIEVGQGLEGDIPDAFASRIINEILTPSFKAGSFDAGFRLATMNLIKASAPNYKVPENMGRQPSKRKSKGFGFGQIIFFILMFAMVGRGRGGGLSSALLLGAMAGGRGGGSRGGSFGGFSSGSSGGFSGGGASGGW